MAEGTVQNIELTLDDGSIVKGTTPDEVIKTLAKMKTDTSSALKEKNKEIEAMQAELAQLRAVQQAEAAKLAQSKTEQERQQRIQQNNGFDREHYYALLNDKPIDAQNYLDSFRFGIPDPQQVPRAFTAMQEKISAFEQQSVAGAFIVEHYEDYDNSPANNALLNARVTQLTSRGYPFEVATLNIAYDQLVREGAIKPLEPQAAPPAPEAPPNPSLSGNSGGAAPAMPEFGKMTTEELRAYMKAQGMSV